MYTFHITESNLANVPIHRGIIPVCHIQKWLLYYYGMPSNAKDDYPIIILGGGDFTGLQEHGCLGDTSSNVSIVTSNSIFSPP